MTRLSAHLSKKPISVLYGGAHLYKAKSSKKLGLLAIHYLEKYASFPDDFMQAFQFGDASLALKVFELVSRKLSHEAIEDRRIDFEDGYGYRLDSEEDSQALASGKYLAEEIEAKECPPFFGIRTKAMAPSSKSRALRTLDLFLNSFHSHANRLSLSQDVWPSICVTLPKVERASEVAEVAAALSNHEMKLGLKPHTFTIELMIESPLGMLGKELGERDTLHELLKAGGGRVRSIHFGSYDFSASLGVMAPFQSLSHEACTYAKMGLLMQLASGQSLGYTEFKDVRLVDGATIKLPISDDEKKEEVWEGWRAHIADLQLSLRQGLYQSWDLHPAQLVSRYIAFYTFFQQSFELMKCRLEHFEKRQAQASRVGALFDDAASARALHHFFSQGLSCHAFDHVQKDLALTLVKSKNLSPMNLP